MTIAIPPTLKERSEISSDNFWGTDQLYFSLKDWEEDFQLAQENPSSPHWPSIASFKGRLQESHPIVKKALEKILSTSRFLEKLYTYAHLKHDEDITNEENKKAYLQASLLFQDFQLETAWFEPELLSLPKETSEKLITDPELKAYRFYLEKIFRMRPHTLSSEMEELLAMASKPLQSTPKAFSALNNADLKFPTIENQQKQPFALTHGLYSLYLRSSDRTLRKNAFYAYHEKFQEFENTLCELIYGEMQSHAFFAKARHHSSCLQAALFPKNVDEKVYHSLIATVRKEGIPLLHRYMKLRKKVLGVSELHPFDLYVPLVPKVDMHLPYEQAESLVIESVKPLGTNYQKLLEQGLKYDKWVDRLENKNKRSGAYSSGCYDSHPYILMNYKGILRDVFTLAHEAGHSMHSLLSRKNQPYHYSHYPIFVAEVASTFNEDLLMHLMLERAASKEEKMFLINEQLEDIRGTLFRQTLFAEFELALHQWAEKEQPLTPALLKEKYLELNCDYFGPDVAIDPILAIEWSRIPHFYYNFYVYQYATGISAAFALSEKVLKGDIEAQKAYLQFLSSGGSAFPIDLLKDAGVDMTSPSPVQSALKKFDSLLTQLSSSL